MGTKKGQTNGKLEQILSRKLFDGTPIFTALLRRPTKDERVYKLSGKEIKEIRLLRGAKVDLHPGMGGVVPDKLIEMIKGGTKLTSLDYMITQGCNFNCTWCFADSGPKMKAFLPYKLLERITGEAVSLGTNFFVITGGEPLVYKDPSLGRVKKTGDHMFQVIEMIRRTGQNPRILTFDDVALITPEIAERFAENEVGLCTKGDTLVPELQDFKVRQQGAFQRMQRGYQNLINAGYGSNPKLRLVVNSVLDQTTFDGMLDLHTWVMERGFDHSIVPVHYCGAAVDDDQEAGVHSPHVKVLYDLLARIDSNKYGIRWHPWSAFPYNKTCNRNRSGLHIKASGDVTSCSESPGTNETPKYTFGNVFNPEFSLTDLVNSSRLAKYREEFIAGHGVYVCSPDVCDLYANDLCLGGCAVRSAYSRIDPTTGLIHKNEDPENYSKKREDPLCPAWTVLAQKQGVLKPGLLRGIHERLVTGSETIKPQDYPYLE